MSRALLQPLHRERGIAVSVHGDGFTAIGPQHELDWVEEKLKASYELTSPSEDDSVQGSMTTRRPPSSTK